MRSIGGVLPARSTWSVLRTGAAVAALDALASAGR
jgi:hypothetical protein